MMLLLALLQAPADPDTVAAMKNVHARFRGRPGTFAQFGDSITITMAFWASLRGGGKNMGAETSTAYALVAGYMKPECWSGWKGPDYGNQGTMTIRWAYENVGKWLAKLNPEVALIMFGTNDLTAVPLEEYEAKTRDVARACLDNGTIVILTTIPPRHGMLEKSKAYAEAVRKVARELRVPLCDYSAEILKRRPEDWDGAADAFKAYKDYDVPTLLARDGVHPSNPKAFAGDYSDEGLRSNGFVLRNHATLHAYASVLRDILGVTPPTPR